MTVYARKGVLEMSRRGLLKDEEFLPAAHSLVAGADMLIYISSFKVELDTKRKGERLVAFFDELRNKARQGLEVRLLTNKQNEQGHVPHTNARAIDYLKKGGVKVRVLPNSRICHAKIIIVDNATAVIGSHNLSVKSCRNNFEMSYCMTDYFALVHLSCWYIELWNKAKPV